MISARTLKWLFVLIVLGAIVWVFYKPWPHVVNSPPRQGPIVAFGDSLTAGTGATAGHSYPDDLSALVGRPIINAGIPGNTVAGAAARLNRDVLMRHPSIVIVLLGGNDLLQRKDFDQSLQKLKSVIRQIQAGGAMVILVGLENFIPMSGISGDYEKLARATGCAYVPDILSGLMGDHTKMSDQIHPNDAGYKIVAARIAKVLKPYLRP